MILPYKQYQPKTAPGVWVAPSAVLIGDVVLEEDVSLWFGTVVRGDVHRIHIGAGTNIQDNSVVHITQHKQTERRDDDGFPTIIGRGVTVGHRSILHGCTVGDFCLIGMGSVLLDGAVIGKESIVAAGSVVPPGKVYPPRSMIMGSPAKAIRELSDEQVAAIRSSWQYYITVKNDYIAAKVGDFF